MGAEMGLDATVRCRCFEEGRLRPGPVPLDDVYVDEEGYLSSRKLDAARARLTYRQFLARYGDLQREFEKWADSCCEHEGGEYCSERVSNWSGCGEFEELVEEAGGEAEFPLLSTLLPDANGGAYPAEKAAATLAELDRFVEKLADVDEWVLRDEEFGKKIWTSTSGGSFPWMMGPFDRVSMVGGKVSFWHAGYEPVETTHFRQIPFGEKGADGCQRMRIVCLDTGRTTVTFDSIGPEGAPKTEREFLVTSEKAPFLYEGKYGTAERIRRLLVASVETGNPIRWC